jgi:hypothetical protein
MAWNCTLEQPEKFGNVTIEKVKSKEKCIHIVLIIISLLQFAYACYQTYKDRNFKD